MDQQQNASTLGKKIVRFLSRRNIAEKMPSLPAAR
jgi:hypothetical protein